MKCQNCFKTIPAKIIRRYQTAIYCTIKCTKEGNFWENEACGYEPSEIEAALMERGIISKKASKTGRITTEWKGEK